MGDRVQISTKSSADGKVRFRVALESGDGAGTSGTIRWLPFRLAIETPTARVCVTEEAALQAGYEGSRHNCSDQLVVTVDASRYQIDAPDTDLRGGPDQASSLSAFSGATRVLGPVPLTNVTCTSNAPSKICASGGPC
jgi:hypothetical protein